MSKMQETDKTEEMIKVEKHLRSERLTKQVDKFIGEFRHYALMSKLDW